MKQHEHDTSGCKSCNQIAERINREHPDIKLARLKMASQCAYSGIWKSMGAKKHKGSKE